MTTQHIEQIIYLIRGQKVILDRDLAVLYGVSTRRLNEQVKRNIERFPDDFMFSLTRQEISSISQIATSSLKFSKNVNAFTENGVAMLSSVLKSKRAVQVNIQIMRTFAKLRQMLSSHKELREKLEIMEHKYDKQFRVVFEAIRSMIKIKEKKKPIGFLSDKQDH
ncbi:MAG: ORF6N domain-containing protein [Candidatus Saganbacteria bacterium]|nr:ORF6N domain-containing protein [Candidatus Saganbacteria bacterium]